MDKYLIINADDFGMCRGSNLAVMELLKAGKITSSTIMAPCAWAPEAAQFANAKASLYGDLKYGNNVQTGLQKEGVALCAYKLTFSHPLTKKEMEFSIVPDNSIFDKAFSE